MAMTRLLLLALLATTLGCERAGRRPIARDTAPPSHAAGRDTLAAPSIPPVPADSMTIRMSATGDSARADTALPALHTGGAESAGDSATVSIEPLGPVRGGVIAATIEAAGGSTPQCTWKSAPLPCYASGTTIRAIIPLPADDPAGGFQLTMDAGGRSARRTIVVGDRDFGRQVVLLDSAHYALVRRGKEIARDARAIRQVLQSESPDARWSGRWLDPGGGARAEGYGTERFYYRASDSSRVMSLRPSARTTGDFGADTTAIGSNDTPSWRHAGVDIALARGAPVRAAAAGIVAAASEYLLTGRTVILDHGQGIHTAYFHLDTITVRPGDVVRRGERLGRVGSTGLATGPHLHYGVYVHGRDVDPAAWHRIAR
jgi:murein DD-endopeptidase MepM/ murein hydrolase activator NlpD